MCNYHKSEINKYKNVLYELKNLALMIERLAPSESGRGPNPEYPWKQGDKICIPANYSFSEIIPHLKYVRLIQFIDKIIQID
jgi:hypothetical protein